MDKRKEELELKRKKLAELRKAREERKQTSKETVKETVTQDTLNEVDQLVASLVGDSRPASAESAKPVEEQKLEQASPIAKYKPALEFTDVLIMDLPPKEIQTAFDEPEDVKIPEEVLDAEKKRLEQELREKIAHEQKEQARAEAQKAQEANEPEKKVISEEQVDNLVKSDGFKDFFDRTTRLMEKALNEKVDFIRDYALDVKVEEEKKDLEVTLSFFDERICSGRTVTDTCWSPKFGELVLASYSKSSNASLDSEGQVLVWNLHLPQRPEFVFESPSNVCTAIFSPYQPNYIIGGTYSGQILLWDTRAKSLPVLKSPLTTSGHAYPVYSMKIVGTQNAHHLVSSSTDGLICSWQVDMLSKPVEQLELTLPDKRKTEELAVTVLDFPDNEASAFWVGTEDGLVLEASRYDAAGGKAGVRSKEVSASHRGFVTGMDFHSSSGAVDFSQYCLTSSVDWTVQLWKRNIAKRIISGADDIVVPVMKFEAFNDYVYDVKWSPKHPSVFACADGAGMLHLWDLNRDVEIPYASCDVGKGHSLNKIAWDKDGAKISAGSLDGKVHVCKSSDHPASSDDYYRMQTVLNLHDESKAVGK